MFAKERCCATFRENKSESTGKEKKREIRPTSSQWFSKKISFLNQGIYILGTQLKLPFDQHSDNKSVAAEQVLSKMHIIFTKILHFGGERESSEYWFLYFLLTETQQTDSWLVSTTIAPKQFGLVLSNWRTFVKQKQHGSLKKLKRGQIFFPPPIHLLSLPLLLCFLTYFKASATEGWSHNPRYSKMPAKTKPCRMQFKKKSSGVIKALYS